MLADGNVRCWGFNGNGQLGNGHTMAIGDDETPGSVGPVDLGAGRTAKAISAGTAHTCAVLDDRSVRCWGFGGDGRLGHGNTNSIGDNETPGSIEPVDLGAGRTANAITTGSGHTCALLDGGGVLCWGYNGNGELGYGHTASVGDNETLGSVEPVKLGAGRTAVAVAAGMDHTCALLDDGNVRCWGYGGTGQLGLGDGDPSHYIGDDEIPTSVEPVDLGAGRRAKAIAAGDRHTCAVLDDGNVRCWGYGYDGRLGYGNAVGSVGVFQTPGTVGPVNLGPGRTAVAISAGGEHTCARLDDGSVLCWGSGAYGRLGYGNQNRVGDNEAPGTVGPVDVGRDRTAEAISAGGDHTCAWLDDGSVRCWGYGGNGRLGYCNERNVGDDEPPSSVGPVPLELASRAPSGEYPGCARPAASPALPPAGAAPAGAAPSSPLAAEAARRRAYRSCLGKAARHARRELGRARRSSGPRRARLKRHLRRHRSRLRRRCLERYGRIPGRVTGLTAKALSRRRIELGFKAPGSDAERPPAARSYLVKQSQRPIRGRRAFRRADTLCNGRCGFPTITAVGAQISLTVEELRPRTTYYYAVAARDNVSGRLGPRSRAVRVRTP